MEPFYLVSLACIIEEYYLNKIRIKFIEGTNVELTEYLSAVNFFKYWETNRKINSYMPSGISTTLSLWKISDEMISGYSNQVQKYLENMRTR